MYVKKSRYSFVMLVLYRDQTPSSTGHVGAPLPCNIVKLVDVEEMNYFASNGEGEVRVLRLSRFGTNPVKRRRSEPHLTPLIFFIPRSVSKV